MMTKKDFIALADTLKGCKPLNTVYMCLWDKVVNEVAVFCKRQNHRFNERRWLAYINGECGPNGGKLKTKTP